MDLHRTVPRWGVVAASVALLACATTRKASIHPGIVLPTAVELRAGGVVLLDEVVTHFRMDPDTGKAVTETTERQQTLFLKRFAERPDDLRVGYSRTFSPTPPTLHAAIISPDGLLEEVDPKRKYDVPAVSSMVLYSDSRLVVLPLPEVPDGAVLDTEEVDISTEPRLFQARNTFGGHFPTRKARWIIRHPAAWEIETAFSRARKPSDITARIERDGDDVLRIYEIDNAPAAIAEARGIWGDNLFSGAARLARWTEQGKEVRAFATDEELAQFHAELNAGTDEADDAIRAQVARLLTGVTDDAEKARKLHAHVTTGIRYCAIELGMGGWRPHTATEVNEAKAGDCKDKANLLKTMLKEAGINSRLAALYAHDGHPRPPGMATLGTTNHAILIVDLPNQKVIVDPTAESVPFGELPTGDRGAILFPISHDDAKPFEAPVAPADQNVAELRYVAKLHPTGIVDGTIKVRATGTPASILRAGIVGATERGKDEALNDWLPLHTSNRRSVQYDGVRLPSEELTVKADVEAELLAGLGRTRVLRLSDGMPVLWPVLPPLERRTPYALSFRALTKTTVELHLPAGSRVRTPPAVALASPFGKYETAWRVEGDVLTVTRQARLDQRVVRSEDYAAFKAFLDSVHAAESRPAVIHVASTEAAQ